MAATSVAASQSVSAGSSEPVLTPFAKRLPKAKKAGDATDDARQELHHVATQQVITLLQAHPHLSMEALGSLQRSVGANKRKRESEDDREARFADKEVGVLSKLLDKWFAGWLQTLTNGALSDELLTKVLRHGSLGATLLRLRKFSLQMSGMMQLPPECSVKKVCARLLNDRHHAVGGPVSQAWVEAAISISGDINWKDGGVLV